MVNEISFLPDRTWVIRKTTYSSKHGAETGGSSQWKMVSIPMALLRANFGIQSGRARLNAW